MSQYIKLFLGICFLRNTPDQVPHSKTLFWLLTALNGFVSYPYIVLVRKATPIAGIAISILSLVLTVLFLHFLLKFHKRSARFLQTATALIGVDALFTIIDFPAVLLLSSAQLPQDDPYMIISSFWVLTLMIFNLLAYGHILKHALSSTMTIGMLWTLGFIGFSIIFIDVLFQ